MKQQNLMAAALFDLNKLRMRVLVIILTILWVAAGLICLTLPSAWIGGADGVILLVVWVIFKANGLVTCYLAADAIFSLAGYYRRQH